VLFNEIVLRAALRLHPRMTSTLSSHLKADSSRPSKLRYAKKFEEKKPRGADLNTGAGTVLDEYLLVKRAADLLAEVEPVHIRLYETARATIHLHGPGSFVRRGRLTPEIYDMESSTGKRFRRLRVDLPDPIGKARVVLCGAR